MPAPIRAATIDVTTNADAGTGSLREAIVTANGSAGADTIRFSLPSGQTSIALASALPAITDDLTLEGPSGGLTIRGASAATPLLQVTSGETIVRDLTLDQGTLSMAAGAKLSFDLAQDRALAQGISDAGALEKRGAAKLTLTGTNTWTGGTTVSAGTLQGNVASLPGDISVAAGATLVFDQAGNGAKAGVISGTGSLIKTGAGTLVLSGTNTFSGQTTVSQGVLEGSAAALPGSFSIAQGARLRFAQTASGTEAGSIGGAGSVEKTGNGTLTLTGANSWSGGTSVLAGALRGAAQSIPGDVAVAIGAEIIFDQPTDATRIGNLSGDGSVSKLGAGTLTLSGTSSYAGGTTISAGALRGTTSSLQGDITNDAALIFAQDADGSFNGGISGGGTLEKTGTGSVRITSSQAYTGSTSIAGGALELDAVASLPGAVNVLAGGTLRGSGSVGSLAASGRIAPGSASSSSFATLSAGAVTFASGSSLDVRVAPGAGNDRLASSGNVVIQPGAALVLHPSAGDYSAPIAFDVLSAAGSVSGSFTDLPRFAFLTLNVTNPGDRITATLQASGGAVGDLAQTDNQRAVAATLEQLQPSASGDLAVVFDSLTLLTEDEVPAALDSLTGEVIADFEHSRVALARRFRSAIDARIAHLDPKPGNGAWITGLGLTGDVDGDDAADFDYRMGGAALGLDLQPTRRLSLGGALGYADSDLDLSHVPGDGNLDSALGALYAGYAAPGYTLSGSAYFAHHEMDSQRAIRFQAIDRNAHAEFDGDDYGAALSGSARMYTRGTFRLEPVGSLAWSRLERSSFSERGAGSLSLDVGDESLDSLQGALGLWAHSRIETSEGVFFAPEAFATWLHEFGDVEREFRASFEGASVSAPFRISGAELPRDSALAGLRWSTQSASGASAEIAYSVLWNTQQLEHSLSLGLNLVW